jgi:hypothetical protein
MLYQLIDKTMDNFGHSRTIHTVTWPEIAKSIEELLVKDYYVGLRHRTRICARINEVAEQTREWLRPVIDLDSLAHAYHVNGTHNSIEQWLATESRSICCLRGEYTYPLHLRPDIQVVDDVVSIPKDCVVYMSNPFSATGLYDERYDLIQNRIVLDIAYVGTTGPAHIRIRDNVEQVFWSGSKPFGLGNFRSGYRFSRKPDSLQEQLKTTGYFNWLSIEILNRAMLSLNVFAGWQRLESDYLTICRRNFLEASDSYLIAISKSLDHLRFKREDGTLRIPAGLILDREYGYTVK